MSLVPFERELDEEEIAVSLRETDGHIFNAAKRMGVDSGRLRMFVEKSPRLMAVIDETLARAVDDSIGVLLEGLHDQASFLNRFYAAKEILRSDHGRRRGFGNKEVSASAIVQDAGQAKVIVLKWLEPQESLPLPVSAEPAPGLDRGGRHED